MKRLIYVMVVLAFISACQKETSSQLGTRGFSAVEETVVEHVNIPLTYRQLKGLFSTIVPIHPGTRSNVYENVDVQDLLDRSGLVVIMFGASWCGPCKMYFPIFLNYAVACQYTDVAFGYYDVEDNEELAVEYGIRHLPTTIFIRDKQLEALATGVLQTETLDALVEQYHQ